MKPIPYGHQDIDEEDINAVVSILKSDFLTQGPKGPEFENALASFCDAKFAVSFSSATAALHLACLALGLKMGSRLWTSPNTFVASANCGLYCNAEVDFVDIDPVTYNMSVTALKLKLDRAQRDGTLPDLVIPVHFAGQSCEMEEIFALSKRYGFKILEDASHSIGAKYKTKPVGSCQFSHATVFSFHPVKVMTTGEGGAVTTNDSDLKETLMRLRSHGITRDQKRLKNSSVGPWYYEQQELGFNYRLTDINATLGLNQLKKVPQFISRRHELANQYDEVLRSLPVVIPKRVSYAHSALHLYPVRLKLDEIKKTKKEIFEELHTLGIMVNCHYIPVHMQPYYQELGFEKGMYPEAENYYEGAMSLPMFSAMTDGDQVRVISALKEVLL